MEALRKNGFFGAAALLAVAWIGLAVSGSPYALLPALLALVAASAGVGARSARWGLVAAAAVGLGCATYLFQQKLALEAGPAICDIGDVFSCSKVNASSYSVVGGVPIALLGAAYYAGLLVAGIFGHKDATGDTRLAQLAVLTGAPAVGYSMFLGWASTQIGAFCVVCITMYLANGLILLLGLRELKAQGKGAFDDLGGLLSGREAVALVVVGGVALWAGVQAYRDADPLAAATPADGGGDTPGAPGSAKPDLAMFYRAPKGTITVDGDEPTLGPAGAKYHIVEYADFGCPHCAMAKTELEELIASRKDVKLTYKFFPLSGSCNPALPDDGGAGKERCDAAVAAECAHRQGKFWDMATQLFTNQGYFAPEQLEFMASKIGVDVPAWKACVADPATLERVRASGKSGGDAGVQGTPALFVGGLRPNEFVDVVFGPPAVLRLIEAREDGAELPPGKAQP